jgi:hypothetical protein
MIYRDDYVIGHRWWNVEELRMSREDFVPRCSAMLVGDIIKAQYPDIPIDCGA